MRGELWLGSGDCHLAPLTAHPLHGLSSSLSLVHHRVTEIQRKTNPASSIRSFRSSFTGLLSSVPCHCDLSPALLLLPYRAFREKNSRKIYCGASKLPYSLC